MILKPRKNIYTPSPNWGSPKYQKGILHPIGFWREQLPPSASPSSANVFRISSVANPVRAGVIYNGTGLEFQNASSGENNYNVSRGNWLDIGDPSNIWMAWTETGTPDPIDITPPSTAVNRLNMGTARQFEIQDGTIVGGAQEGTYTITFYDAQTGGNNIGSATVTLTAERDVGQ